MITNIKKKICQNSIFLTLLKLIIFFKINVTIGYIWSILLDLGQKKLKFIYFFRKR